MKKDMAKLGITLALFASVACACLAVVYAFTKENIEMQAEKQFNASMQELFPQANAFDKIQGFVSSDPNIKFETAYEVKNGTIPLGLAIKAVGPSYGGTATLLVAVDLHRSIAGVEVIELKDTPGLGMNASNPNYYVNKAKKTTFVGQFAGKFLTDPFEVKKDVVAITAATITSRSLTKIIKAAGDAAIAYMDQKMAVQTVDSNASQQQNTQQQGTQPNAGGK